MTKVTFYENNGRYTGFKAEGHAGFADKGSDIVCSSISILVINTVNSLEELCNERMDVREDEEKGLISMDLCNTWSDDAQLLLRSLKLGLDRISEEYGKKHLKVITKEVNDNVKA
ncbi:MAG: ribosomal-processing cysteine protease Prp [Lachnospiraceae bacterium]|nr:ribosomal-processing cysteine protease Prp [Lachnospiraceae bacterium]